jgi:hypothetical protein
MNSAMAKKVWKTRDDGRAPIKMTDKHLGDTIAALTRLVTTFKESGSAADQDKIKMLIRLRALERERDRRTKAVFQKDSPAPAPASRFAHLDLDEPKSK